jgi:signal transduction histidine kinase
MNTARRLISVLWTEPRVPHVPKRSMFDWILCAAVGMLTITDILVTDQLDNAYIPILFGLLLAAALPWRRSHSLAVLIGGVIVAMALDFYLFKSEIADPEFGSTLLALVIATYALTRWSSGRHIVIGTAAILLVIICYLTILANSSSQTGEDAASSIAFWLFPMALGVAMRYRTNVKDHRIRSARLEERESLARELHDTVAHHVSAIAIQAQAAQAVSSGTSEDVKKILESIEKSASIGLSEMRKVVGALRQDEDPLLNPQINTEHFERLAETEGVEPRIELELPEGLDELGPSNLAALYRTAQESITNARRHAVGVTRIAIAIEISNGSVRLTVTDDGEPTSPAPESTSGLGLVGLVERAKLLGGEFEAVPGSDWGWVVKVELPLETPDR